MKFIRKYLSVDRLLTRECTNGPKLLILEKAGGMPELV